MRLLVNVLSAGLISIGLAACLVSGPNYVVYEPEPKAGRTKAAAPKMSLAEDVRARLYGECMSEHGRIVRTDDKLEQQCECFAGTVAKSMRRDDQEFYAQYGVVPTLSAARPDDVKKQCGIAVIDRSGSRGRLPAPESY